jgi:transcriptional regulator with XRE-family HTH domain
VKNKQAQQTDALANFLRESRISQDISQLSIAKKLGYSSAQFVSNWERGLSAPPLSCVVKLAKLLKVSEHTLFEKIVEMNIEKVEHDLRREFKQMTKDKRA